GPKTVAELAQAADTHAPSLFRLLRMLASVGVGKASNGGRFCARPLSETLVTGAPGSSDLTSEISRVLICGCSFICGRSFLGPQASRLPALVFRASRSLPARRRWSQEQRLHNVGHHL
ncbi:MAG TPA: hypothetical protein VFZ71_02055, partial [Pyrinomonadaceae bacterium]